MNSYKTIQQPSEGSYKEKGSKFLSFAIPAGSEEGIRAEILSLKRKYFDAHHHCFAWILGPDKKFFRAFDDGEPNHAAGDPILGQIRSRDLTNVLVVVVRYFGGTKLGVGGLITAYKAAAASALDSAVIVERNVVRNLSLHYDYSATPEVMKLVKDFDLVILAERFSDTCVLNLEYRLEIESPLLEKIALLRNTGSDVHIGIQGQ